MIPFLAITMGEPAGIGPDIIAELASRGRLKSCVVIGDANVLNVRAQQLSLTPSFQVISTIAQAKVLTGNVPVLHIPVKNPVVPGVCDVANVEQVIAVLTMAITLSLNKEIDGIVTAPVHKAIINDAGISFSGHTEFFAECSNTPRVVMMLAHGNFRVALATTHCPLSEVPAFITRELLHETLTILHHDLQTKWGISKPTIFVCGLNPHAGENGYLGREEIDTIIPVIQEWQLKHYRVQGPFPADTVFTPDSIAACDAILAMYHDQGLPTLKYAGFHHAVNITLGLPFIRTSVDHGTACDIAGTGKANAESLIAAIELAKTCAALRTTGHIIRSDTL